MKIIKKQTRSLLSRYDFTEAILFIKKNKNDIAIVIYCTKYFIEYIQTFISNQISDTANINILITNINEDLLLSTSSSISKKIKQKRKVVKNIKERLTKKQGDLLHEENLFNVTFLEKEQNSMASVAGHLLQDQLFVNTTFMNERLVAENEDFISRISIDNSMGMNYDEPLRNVEEEAKIQNSMNKTRSRSFSKIDEKPLIKSSIIETSINDGPFANPKRPIINNIYRKDLGGLSFLMTIQNSLKQIKNFAKYTEEREQEFQFEDQQQDDPEFVRRMDTPSVSMLDTDEKTFGYKNSGADSSKMNTFTGTIDESPIKKYESRESEKMQLYNLIKFQHDLLLSPTNIKSIPRIEFHDLLNVVHGNLTKEDVCGHFWNLLNLQSEGKIDCEMKDTDISIQLNIN